MVLHGAKGGPLTVAMVTSLVVLALAQQTEWSAWAVSDSSGATSHSPATPAVVAPVLANAPAAVVLEPAASSWLGQVMAPSGPATAGTPSAVLDAAASAAMPASSANLAFADAAAPRPDLTPPPDPRADQGVSDLTGVALLLGGALALAGWRRARR